MIDRDHKLPLARQAKAVGISRGSIYYRPRPVGEAGLGLMRRIDELHLEHPFAGSRMMRGLLRQEGLSSGRRHIATLMRRMGIEALYRKPNTSRRRPGHTVYPYLLRGLEVSRPNQVWAMDITYIPMARGFVYLAAVMDWHSRKVLAWRVSVTMDTDFCVEALEESLGRHGVSMSSDYVRLSGQGKCPSRPLSYHRTVIRGTCPWCASWAGSWLRRTCGPCSCGCPTPWRLPEWRGPEA